MSDAAAEGGAVSYRGQLEALRSTAKWLVTGCMGVAAAMIAGVQLASVGRLSGSSWRLYVALVAVAVVLLAIVYMIKEASRVLSHEWLTLADLRNASLGVTPDGALVRSRKDRDRKIHVEKIMDQLDGSRHELYGYVAPTLPLLHKRLREANEQMLAPGFSAASNSDVVSRAAELRGAAHDVVQCANYLFTLFLFQRMRTRLGWAAALLAVGVGAFIYAANPAEKHSPIEIRIVNTNDAPHRYGG
jgi:hypothetical protein